MQDSKRDDLLAQAEQYQTVLNNLWTDRFLELWLDCKVCPPD